MGIRDFFRRNKKVPQVVNYEDRPDFSLMYRSGIEANITFNDLQDLQLDNGTSKRLQGISVLYNMPDGKFQSKQYYMEPIFDDKGNNITKESYIRLGIGNQPLIKGFFAKEQLDKQSTNYIGYIDYDENGKPRRGKDINFERDYKGHLDRQRARAEEARELRFQAELQNQLNDITVNIDNDQPEDLSKVPCPYPNNRNKNNNYR